MRGAWPDGVDAAIASLDRVPADVAAATLSSVRGLAAGVHDEVALAAHRRLVEHVERAAREGDPDPSLGGPALASLMSSREALEVDLGRLAERADAERDRLRALLRDACDQLAPGVPVAEVLSRLEHDHPDPDGVLVVFSRASLPAVTLHEVAPGHFSHGRALRRVTSQARSTLLSHGFAEGWAHYGEELALEQGFRDGDPLVQAGVAIEALVRVTRLRVAIGVHTGALTVAEGAAAFTEDAGLQGPEALSEARRSTYDPTYGHYTWGKLELLPLRDRARQRPGFDLRRFHGDVLAMGAPPLGLMDAALAG
jgi:hypothetical protein